MVSEQQIIDVGLSPNDGLGDPIRTSFIKCNDNFDLLFSQALRPVANTYYVQVNGDDSRTGRTWGQAFRTIEYALQVATIDKTENPAAITLIEVGAGRYFSQGNLDMPDDCVLRCAHRTVVIAPESDAYKQRNVVRMGSGCFVEGFLFDGWQLDSLDNPTEGFAVSFRPGAIIRRVPYAHKIAVRTPVTWGQVAPPTDPFADPPNPQYPIGGGVALADALVLSPKSIYPNIMTWGATPVVANGIGYCAKNGGLINAINAISLWAHKHYYAISGGQIILSSCSTQFGDYTLVSKGDRDIIFPASATVALFIDPTAAAVIEANKNSIVDQMYSYLLSVPAFQVDEWTLQQQEDIREAGREYVQCVEYAFESADQIPMQNFAKGFFNVIGAPLIPVSPINQGPAYNAAFLYMRDRINALGGVDNTVVTSLTDDLLLPTINTPNRRVQPSIITAIGHQWSSVLAGVALTKIPPAFNRTTIEASILEQDDGRVIASGQDDQGNALFVGGMKISAETGELSGPPFESAVTRIATKSAIAFSQF